VPAPLRERPEAGFLGRSNVLRSRRTRLEAEPVGDVRITVIDDDRDVLDLFRELFDYLDRFEVTTFTDALPGIHELIDSRPDLIVIDLELRPEREELSGLQVIHSARTSEELRDVPIIVSYTEQLAMDEAWAGFMQRGDIHMLAKPFGVDIFTRVVNTALGRVQAGPDSAGEPLEAMGDGDANADRDQSAGD
jgi:CheY-like chemotaxis protein